MSNHDHSKLGGHSCCSTKHHDAHYHHGDHRHGEQGTTTHQVKDPVCGMTVDPATAKHRTTIGRHARMGSDNMYVAPVTVGDGAYSGAGTVVRKDVPAGALAINVAPQRNLEGWVEANRPGTPAAQAAEAASDRGTDK